MVKKGNEKITLKHLNTKIWYRLIKVLFILAIIAVLIFSEGVFIGKKLDKTNYEKSSIICNIGNKNEFHDKTLAKEIENFKDWRYISKNDTEIAKNLKTKIINKCSISDKKTELYLEKMITFNLVKNNFTDFERNDWLTIFIIFLSVLLFEETIRRLFYYIILREFFPNKK